MDPLALSRGLSDLPALARTTLLLSRYWVTTVLTMGSLSHRDAGHHKAIKAELCGPVLDTAGR